jgi:hypothetical protein
MQCTLNLPVDKEDLLKGAENRNNEELSDIIIEEDHDSETLEENVNVSVDEQQNKINNGNASHDGEVVDELLNSIVNEAVMVEVDEKDTNSEGREKQENEVECIRNEYREKLELKDKVKSELIDQHKNEITELKDNQRKQILELNDRFVGVREQSEDLRNQIEQLKAKHKSQLLDINEQFKNVRKEKEELRIQNADLQRQLQEKDGMENAGNEEEIDLLMKENERVIAIANKIVSKLQKDKKETMEQLALTNKSLGDYVKKHEILVQENITYEKLVEEQLVEQERMKEYLTMATGKTMEDIEDELETEDRGINKEEEKGSDEDILDDDESEDDEDIQQLRKYTMEFVKNKNRGFKRTTPQEKLISGGNEKETSNNNKNNSRNKQNNSTTKRDSNRSMSVNHGNKNNVIERNKSSNKSQQRNLKYCHFFNNRNYCKNGNNCQYSHERAPECVNDGRCSFRQCMFSHRNQSFPQGFPQAFQFQPGGDPGQVFYNMAYNSPLYNQNFPQMGNWGGNRTKRNQDWRNQDVQGFWAV